MTDPAPFNSRVEADPDGQAWSLHWGGTRFDIRLHQGMLLCDYFGPETESRPAPLWQGWREQDIPQNTRCAAMVEIGPRAAAVPWRLEDWAPLAQNGLRLTLRAEHAALACELCFEVDTGAGVLRRATVLRNLHPAGGPAIPIASAVSVWVTLRSAVDRVTFLTGAWGEEGQTRHVSGSHCVLTMDSRTGKTGFEFQPWMTLRSDNASWLCELLWSGNWVMQARLRPSLAILSGGLNDWGLEHHLAAGESLALPEALLAYVPGPPDAATRRLHDWRRARRPDPDRPVPVQFNTWYVCDEIPDEAWLSRLIPRAVRLGCEVFVLDAGWYGSAAGDPDDDWYLRVGDWIVDRRRLPNGLRALRDSCAAVGMGFGIWCEPESVGPRARIRQTHPDWFHHPNGRPPPSDGRALLHLGVPGAWDHALGVLSGLVRESGATWLKWDFNADLGAGGWAPDLAETLRGQDPLVAHYQGLYRLQDALRAAHPDLVLEMCASGAGRMDGALLSRAHTNWLSDQPQAVAKLAIHFGLQRAHPAVSCNDWLIDWPPRGYRGVEGTDKRGDLAFRLHVAMLGSFGISAPIDTWTEADIDVAAPHVALYREKARALVHHGDQYPLTPPPPLDGAGEWAAMWYVAKDGRAGVLFAFRLHGAETRTFPLPGLLPGPWRLTGDNVALTDGGARVALEAPFRSAMVVFEVE